MNQQRVNAVMFGAAGLGTEAGTRPYELTVCIQVNQAKPMASSGYSVGVMQTDFGQRGHEPDLLTPGSSKAQAYVAATDAWGQAHGKPPLDADTLRKLHTRGANWEALSAKDMAIFKEFGKSPEGKTWVAAHLDKPLLDGYHAKIEPVMNGPAFSKWSEEDKLNAVAAMGKMCNQRPKSFDAMKEIIDKQHADYSPAQFRGHVQAVQDAGPSYLAFTKAYDIAKSVTPLYAHEASATRLDRAGVKIQSLDFNPAAVSNDSDLRYFNRAYTDPKFLQSNNEAIRTGQPLPEALQKETQSTSKPSAQASSRAPYINAFETQPLAKALALYPNELVGAGHAMKSAEQYAKQFPASLQAGFLTDIKGRLTEHMCKNGPLPTPASAHQVQPAHTPSQSPPFSQAPRHDMAPKL